MRTIIIALSLLYCLHGQSEVRLSPLFTDNMVMQQTTDAPIWGITNTKHAVSIITSWDKKTYNAMPDKDGHFITHVSTPKAGGPYSITISDGTPITIDNVLIGEVWLCSGQSNMDFPVKGWGQTKNCDEELKNADHYRIRLLHVNNTMRPHAQTEFEAVGGGWQLCSAETVAGFSAVGYFFGRDIELNENVPVGLIESAWGGTPVEAWISSEFLSTMSDFKKATQRIINMPDDIPTRKHFYDEEITSFEKQLKNIDDNSVINADETCNRYLLPGLLTQKEFADFDGIIWCYKTIGIPHSWQNKELKLRLGMIDDNDVTYFNGKVIGRMDGYAENRVYSINADFVKEGKATIAIRIMDIGGYAGIVGYKDHDICIELDAENSISLNGEWLIKKTIPLADIPELPRNPITDAKNVCMLYNAMINPLVPFSIKGVIWYQGEDNVNRAYQYRELLPLLIEDWRKQWNNRFPFYIAQLANYHPKQKEPGESKWAELREAQHLTAKHKDNVGVACLIDIGDANDIHPANKQEVARRLALLARAYNYGEQIESSGPVYNNHVISGDKVILHFINTDKGLTTSDGKTPRGFAIAGLDHKFYWAETEIKGNTVILWSPKVKHPIAIRYAWADNPDCNLCNSKLLPTYPFRTDDWPGMTLGNIAY